jgi:hypothetical protein
MGMVQRNVELNMNRFFKCLTVAVLMTAFALRGANLYVGNFVSKAGSATASLTNGALDFTTFDLFETPTNMVASNTSGTVYYFEKDGSFGNDNDVLTVKYVRSGGGGTGNNFTNMQAWTDGNGSLAITANGDVSIAAGNTIWLTNMLQIKSGQSNKTVVDIEENNNDNVSIAGPSDGQQILSFEGNIVNGWNFNLYGQGLSLVDDSTNLNGDSFTELSVMAGGTQFKIIADDCFRIAPSTFAGDVQLELPGNESGTGTYLQAESLTEGNNLTLGLGNLSTIRMDYTQNTIQFAAPGSGTYEFYITQNGTTNFATTWFGTDGLTFIDNTGNATLRSVNNSGVYTDSTSSTGTSGQVLTSTGSATMWADASSGNPNAVTNNDTRTITLTNIIPTVKVGNQLTFGSTYTLGATGVGNQLLLNYKGVTAINLQDLGSSHYEVDMTDPISTSTYFSAHNGGSGLSYLALGDPFTGTTAIKIKDSGETDYSPATNYFSGTVTLRPTIGTVPALEYQAGQTNTTAATSLVVNILPMPSTNYSVMLMGMGAALVSPQVTVKTTTSFTTTMTAFTGNLEWMVVNQAIHP